MNLDIKCIKIYLILSYKNPSTQTKR